MGWKTLKERFDIGHIVQVVGDQIYIGSGYVADLATVDMATGIVTEKPEFRGFLSFNCHSLLAATPEDVRQAIHAVDLFSADIPVYTYEGGQILEKRCETPGWPNVTHDGCLMYENTFFLEKADAIRRAKSHAAMTVQYARQSVERAQQELAEKRACLAQREAERAALEAEYPEDL